MSSPATQWRLEFWSPVQMRPEIVQKNPWRTAVLIGNALKRCRSRVTRSDPARARTKISRTTLSWKNSLNCPLYMRK